MSTGDKKPIDSQKKERIWVAPAIFSLMCLSVSSFMGFYPIVGGIGIFFTIMTIYIILKENK